MHHIVEHQCHKFFLYHDIMKELRAQFVVGLDHDGTY